MDCHRVLVEQSATVGDSYGQHQRRRGFKIQRRRIQNCDLPGRRVHAECTARVARDNAVTGRVTRIRITGCDHTNRCSGRRIFRQGKGRRIQHRSVVGPREVHCCRLRPVRRHSVADHHTVHRGRFVTVVHELHEASVNLSLSEAGDRHARGCHILEPAAGNTADGIRQLRCRLFEVRGTQIGRSQHDGAAFGDRERVVDDCRCIVRCQNLNVGRADVTAEDAVFHGHCQNASRVVGVLRRVVVGDCAQHLLIHGFGAGPCDGQYAVRVAHEQRRTARIRSENFVGTVDQVSDRDCQPVEIRCVRIPRDGISVRDINRVAVFHVIDEEVSASLTTTVVRIQIKNRSRPDDRMIDPKL